MAIPTVPGASLVVIETNFASPNFKALLSSVAGSFPGKAVPDPLMGFSKSGQPGGLRG